VVTEERRAEFRRQLIKTFRLYSRFYDLIEVVVPFLRANPRLEVTRKIPAEAGMVLDACTGNGAVLAALAKTHPASTVYGLDLSPDMLKLAERRIRRKRLANVKIFSGDCTKMPFPDSTFDAVAGSYGLHEMPLDIRRGALAEALRVLAPKGLLVLIDWDAPRGFLQRIVSPLRDSVEPGYIDELFGDGLARLVKEAGFEDVVVERKVILSQLVLARKP